MTQASMESALHTGRTTCTRRDQSSFLAWRKISQGDAEAPRENSVGITGNRLLLQPLLHLEAVNSAPTTAPGREYAMQTPEDVLVWPVRCLPSASPTTFHFSDGEAARKYSDNSVSGADLKCPGWDGGDCSVRDERPCTNTWRTTGTAVMKAPASLSEPGWTASRCGGGSLSAAWLQVPVCCCAACPFFPGDLDWNILF